MQRDRSLLGSKLLSSQNKNNNQNKQQRIQKSYKQAIQNIKERPKTLKQQIKRYRDARLDQDQKQSMIMFRKQQLIYKQERDFIHQQLKKMQDKADTPQYNFVKGELVKAIKTQMVLQMQLDQIVQQRKKQKQAQQNKHLIITNNVRIQNQVNDIMKKYQQIIYLEESLKECLKLLEVIGILVHDQGEKIDSVAQNVKKAFEQIDKAQKLIDQAKKRSQAARRKLCCIIIFGLIAIILVLIVLYKVSIINI